MAQVGLDHVHEPLLEERPVVPLGIEALAGGDVHRRVGVAEPDQALQVVRLRGLFEEQQVERRERPHEPRRARRPAAAVVVDHDVDRRADGVAQQGEPFGEDSQPLHLGKQHVVAPGAGLHRREAVRDVSLGVRDHLVRVVDADMGVEPDVIARGTAEQPVHRHPPRLAAQVPQRLVQAGDGGVDHRAAPPEAVPVEALPVVLHRQRIAADQHRAQLGDRRLHGPFLAFQGRLAPAIQVGVGADLHDHPVSASSPGDRGADVLDLHDASRAGGGAWSKRMPFVACRKPSVR